MKPYMGIGVASREGVVSHEREKESMYTFLSSIWSVYHCDCTRQFTVKLREIS